MSTGDTQVLYDADEYAWIVLKYGEGRLGTFPQESDARLFAVAPELLSALKSVVQLMASIYDSGKMEETRIIAWRQMLDRIRHVVEKAEGQTR